MGNVYPDDNWQVHFRDTMRGGKMLNHYRMAELHAKEAPDRVRELEDWGALFDRTKDGLISQRDFGGHRFARLAHVGDRTGLELIRTLQQRVVALGGTAAISDQAASQAIAAGVSRGVLSNEAGLGSAPIAHGIASVKHPAEQGVVGIFEVWVDTIVVCTVTAFIILESGLWTDPAYARASGDLTAAALGTTIPGAQIIVAVCSFLFGFSTLIGWYYYGEKCVEFLFGSRIILPYKIVFTALIMVGAVVSVPLVWAVGTLLNGFMAFPNLIGLLLLLGTVRKITQDYFSNGGREYSVKHPTTGAPYVG